MATALFKAAVANDGDSLTRPELKAAFTKWFTQWDPDKDGSLDEQELRNGLNGLMPRPNFGPGGPGGPGGAGGFDGGAGRPGRAQRGGGQQGQNRNPDGRGPGGPGGPDGRGGFGPPAKPLTAEQVGLVRAWIDQGAK